MNEASHEPSTEFILSSCLWLAMSFATKSPFQVPTRNGVRAIQKAVKEAPLSESWDDHELQHGVM